MLRVLGRMQGPVGVSELAAAVGIPKATAHRLLEQMARENIVERRDRKWVLAPGFHDLDRRQVDLGVLARRRLYEMTRATGATLCLYQHSTEKLRLLARAHGRLMTQVMTSFEQSVAPEHPASAMWQAIESGQLAAEHREVHPECCCIATPFGLPSGDIAVLGLALPDHRAVELLKRPLDRVASQILDDVNRLQSL
jgi:predicted ArsR family transcriptional regulator